jgi:hypothetical protein
LPAVDRATPIRLRTTVQSRTTRGQGVHSCP